MKKRIFTIFLALLICLPLVLTSCTTQTPFTPRQELDSKTLGYYSPAIKVTYARPWFGNMNQTLYEKGWTMEENNWTDAIYKDLGIKLELEWAINDYSQYYQKLVSSIATNDLPEIINVHAQDDAYFFLEMLNNNDAITNIWPYYEEYASDDLREIYDSVGEEIFYPATFDGEIKALCSLTGSENESWSFFWIRKDWLDNLNIAVPDTFDELIDVIKAFHDNDPDGDGLTNTYGIPFDNSFFVYGTPIFNCNHAYYDMWVDDGEGNLVYSSLLPEVKSTLSVLADLYQGGYLDADMTYYETAIRSGKCGIWPGKVHNGLMLQNVIDNNPAADFIPIRLVSCDGDPAMPQAEIPSYQYYVVNKESKHPEVLVKLLNYYLYISGLDSDDPYAKDMMNDEDARELWQMAPVNIAKPGENFIRASKVAEALSLQSGDDLEGVDKDVYDWVMAYRNGDNSYWGWNAIYGGYDSSEYLMGEYIENSLYKIERFVSSKTESMSLYGDDLLANLTTGFFSIINGTENINYFDALVSNWYENGGRQITDEVNEWYDTIK